MCALFEAPARDHAPHKKNTQATTLRVVSLAIE